MTRIDINADLGESYGAFQVGEDEKLLQVISSANIACGFHAGDYNVMDSTIQLAKEQGVAIGAHPGFPDVFGFGRRDMSMSPEEIYRAMVYQLGAISGYCRVHDVQLSHVKPHGALYNMAAKQKEVAEAIAKAVFDFDSSLILYGLCNSLLLNEGKRLGLSVAAEAFADRTYTEEGLLTPRTQDYAVLTTQEEIEKQVLNMVENGHVTTSSGKNIDLKPDTICFHGDGLAAFVHAGHMKRVLEEKGITVQSVGE